jgi:hypothetical protein
MTFFDSKKVVLRCFLFFGSLDLGLQAAKPDAKLDYASLALQGAIFQGCGSSLTISTLPEPSSCTKQNSSQGHSLKASKQSANGNSLTGAMQMLSLPNVITTKANSAPSNFQIIEEFDLHSDDLDTFCRLYEQHRKFIDRWWEFEYGEKKQNILHAAIQLQSFKIAMHLTDFSEFNNVQDVHGNYPLHYAALAGHFVLVTKLCKHFPPKDLAQNKLGNTPLHEAVRSRSPDASKVVERLAMYFSGMLEVKNSCSCTPVAVAAKINASDDVIMAAYGNYPTLLTQKTFGISPQNYRDYYRSSRSKVDGPLQSLESEKNFFKMLFYLFDLALFIATRVNLGEFCDESCILFQVHPGAEYDVCCNDKYYKGEGYSISESVFNISYELIPAQWLYVFLMEQNLLDIFIKKPDTFNTDSSLFMLERVKFLTMFLFELGAWGVNPQDGIIFEKFEQDLSSDSLFALLAVCYKRLVLLVDICKEKSPISTAKFLEIEKVIKSMGA